MAMYDLAARSPVGAERDGFGQPGEACPGDPPRMLPSTRYALPAYSDHALRGASSADERAGNASEVQTCPMGGRSHRHGAGWIDSFPGRRNRPGGRHGQLRKLQPLDSDACANSLRLGHGVATCDVVGIEIAIEIANDTVGIPWRAYLERRVQLHCGTQRVAFSDWQRRWSSPVGRAAVLRPEQRECQQRKPGPDGYPRWWRSPVQVRTLPVHLGPDDQLLQPSLRALRGAHKAGGWTGDLA